MERDISVTELNDVYVVVLSKRALAYILGSVEEELRTSPWGEAWEYGVRDTLRKHCTG